MKSIIPFECLHRSKLFLAATVLSLSAFCAGATEVWATSEEQVPETVEVQEEVPEKIEVQEEVPEKVPVQEKVPKKVTVQDKIAEKIQELQQSDKRWIQVNLKSQRLIAWEGGKPVYAIVVSTGKNATPTPVGTYTIQTKHEKTRMRGADYDVPNVPYTMYYHRGYAIHGAYWHRKFGTPVSHGCVNVAVNHAKWLFDWAKVGTPVVVVKQ